MIYIESILRGRECLKRLEMDGIAKRKMIISRIASFVSEYLYYEINWKQIAIYCGVIDILDE